MTEKSLAGEFRVGQELYKRIENTKLASFDLSYQQDVKSAISYFINCVELVDKLSIFSANETVEDINTGDLRFLLVEAYLGDLTTKLNDKDRMQILNKAKLYFEQFLRNVELHEILKEEDRKFIEEQTNEIKKDAAKKREEKIARYKREKETKMKLETLQQILLSSGHDDKEDISRKHVLTLIDLFIQKSIEQLMSIQQELELLNQMRKIQEQSGPSPLVEMANDNRVETIFKDTGPLLTKDGKPLRPFVIMNREAIREQVFRPGWRLPTMTIDEYLEQEAARGNVISGGGQIPEKKEIDDNDERALDEETLKAREWDEFKDAHPYGSGNRMRKG
ncbi:TAP42-like protein [Glomus cerebriforme]|uniref:TAP42-like protein n=1 Tax=Glomus cerebriforme TaxID=658196 RepID=A0A397SLT3_9GLOM|nr:TAP42-like protein [Glomus cerebriforme]